MQLFVDNVFKVYQRTKHHFLHLFCYVTFSCWFWIFRSRSVAWVWFSTGASYNGSGGYLTATCGPLSNFSNCIPSVVNFHCCVHLSHERGDVMVGFSHKASICRVVLRESVVDCAMLCSVTLLVVNWVATVVLPTELNAKLLFELSQLKCFILLGPYFWWAIN